MYPSPFRRISASLPRLMMASIALMVSLSIFQLVLKNVFVSLRMICKRRFEKRMRFIASRVVPVAFFILIHPRRRPSSASLGINAGAKLLITAIFNVRADNNRHFVIVDLMRNAVFEPARVIMRKVFCISFCLSSAAF
nr:MAG TPA: hypothetical protein [Caudoviricetes sp.]